MSDRSLVSMCAGLTLDSGIAAALAALGPQALLAGVGQSRLAMEVAALFSHGAGAPALALLWRHALLDALLPLHAAHMRRHKGARNPRCAHSTRAASSMECIGGLARSDWRGGSRPPAQLFIGQPISAPRPMALPIFQYSRLSLLAAGQPDRA